MIPEHLIAFLRANIKSVWALDLLVLIKTSPDRSFTAAALNDRLRASPSLVEEILGTFTRQGLVSAEANGGYRYAPAGSETDAAVSELTRLYAERPMAVIKEILSAPNEKIHSFVDAFRLKKD
jgi:DNA-binding IclR family transcriptional regulator